MAMRHILQNMLWGKEKRNKYAINAARRPSFCHLSEEDLRHTCPNSSPWSIDVLLRFGNKGDLLFIDAYNIYRSWASEYLMQLLFIREYDAEMACSGLGFETIAKSKMDMYQYFTSDELQFLFIGNNVYVENLSAEEWDFIARRSAEGTIEVYDAEIEAFVEQTFEKVLGEGGHSMDEGLRYMVQFGPGSSYFAPSDAIVLGMRYNKWRKTVNEDEAAWLTQNDRRREFFSSLQECMKAEASLRLRSHKIAVFEYANGRVPYVKSMQAHSMQHSLRASGGQLERFKMLIDSLTVDFMAAIDSAAPEKRELIMAFRNKLQNCILYNDDPENSSLFAHLSNEQLSERLISITRDLCEKSNTDKCRALLNDDHFNLLNDIQRSLENAVRYQRISNTIAGCINYDKLGEIVLMLPSSVMPWNRHEARHLASQSIDNLIALLSAHY